ncbi:MULTISPECIES: hypothetical protein [unclassified Microcoleus]|uniref:hypothetical protein n=1 Tax=unclassified Microcoleus TaxID=2642155 RepID=UPI002FD2AA56
MKLIPQTLPDLLATIFGVVAGIAQLSVFTNRISQDDGLFISGLATIALGVITNKYEISKSNPHKPPNYSALDFAPYDAPPYNDPYYEPPSEIPPKAPKEIPGRVQYETPYKVPNQTQYHSKYIGQPKQENYHQEHTQGGNQGQKGINESHGCRGKRRTRKRSKTLDTKSDSNSPVKSDSLSGSC